MSLSWAVLRAYLTASSRPRHGLDHDLTNADFSGDSVALVV